MKFIRTFFSLFAVFIIGFVLCFFLFRRPAPRHEHHLFANSVPIVWYPKGSAAPSMHQNGEYPIIVTSLTGGQLDVQLWNDGDRQQDVAYFEDAQHQQLSGDKLHFTAPGDLVAYVKIAGSAGDGNEVDLRGTRSDTLATGDPLPDTIDGSLNH